MIYSKHLASRLRYSFPGSDTIEHNWSQAGQDIWVLSMLNGLRGGTFLEIGSCYGESMSNTCLLERDFGWRGTGIEINTEFVGEYNACRTNKSHCGDATTADYVELLRRSGIEETTLDYLSCDCEPASNTLKALQQVLSQGLKFALITFEHDDYANYPDQTAKIESRRILREHGYVLVASNISASGDTANFEDWWAHPDLIDQDFIELFRSDGDDVKYWADYIYPN